MHQRRNSPINILRCMEPWRYFDRIWPRNICLRAVVCAGAPLLFSLAPASAQLLGIPQVNVSLPPPGEVPDLGPVGVLERPRPQLQPQGFQLSGVRVLPSFTVGPTYDSNVFATGSNPAGDILFDEHPALTLDSAPGLVSFRFIGYGDFVQYVNNGQLSNANGGASLGIRGDLASTLLLESLTGLVYGHQDPASFSTSIANGPVPYLPEYTQFRQTLSATREVGVLGASLSGAFQRSTYQDVLLNGVLLNQSQFNGNTYTVSPRVSYLISPPTRLYVQATYQRNAYDGGGINSNSYTGALGTQFEFRRLIRGNVYAGYTDWVYDSSAIGTVGGFTYGVDVAWYPTEVLTAKLSGKQYFSNSAAPGATTSASVVNTKTIQGQLDYEAGYQVILSAVAAYENDNYQSAARIDDIMKIGLTARYMLNSRASIDLLYLYSMRQSSQVGFNYDRQQVGLALKLQY
jgi:hypothetical protein